MVTVNDKNGRTIHFAPERFASMQKAIFEGLYKSHLPNPGEVWELIQKINGQAKKATEELPKSEPMGTSRKPTKRKGA
jgi:hypothetical protein